MEYMCLRRRFALCLVLPHLVPAIVIHGKSPSEEHRWDEQQNVDQHFRPNILFLMTDSMDGRLLDQESYEFSSVDLPFLKNTLLKSGTHFPRAYTHNPVCVPSRTSMMTGRTSDRLQIYSASEGLAASPGGVLDDACVNFYGADRCTKMAEQQGYPETILSALKHLGYSMRMEGRLDIGGGYMNSDPHNETIYSVMGYAQAYGSFVPDDYTRLAGIWIQGRASEYLESASEAREHIETPNHYGGVDAYATSQCLQFIRGLPDNKWAKRPFFLYCSYSLPHFPYQAAAQWFAKVNESNVAVPTWNEGFPEKWHPYDVFKSISDGVVGDWNTSDIIRLRRIYYAMCAEADHNLGRLWHALQFKGYTLKNMYVVYVSDHGEMKFEHRQMMKSSMYEGSVRVPMIIAGPGIKWNHRVNHLTSLLDIFPTMLDMARVREPAAYEGLSGKSLMSVAGALSSAPENVKLDESRDFVHSVYNWVKVTTGAYMARSGRWKYICYGHAFSNTKDFAPRLFDVEADPLELKDVAADYPDVVASMDRKLREHLDVDAEDKRVAKRSYDNLMVHGKDKLLAEDAPMMFRTAEHMKGFAIESDPMNKFAPWLDEAAKLFGTDE